MNRTSSEPTGSLGMRGQPSGGSPREVVKYHKLVFWDFDGVIKESVYVKSEAFHELFLPYGPGVANRVRRHHEANGGVSRYEKIPTYLDWAGEQPTDQRITEFCERFSHLVCQAVIDSPWVPGVREYLAAHHERQSFVLVTATPEGEIQKILEALGISRWFREVHGAPTQKATVIENVLKSFRCPAEDAIAIGDSQGDLEAAEANHVTFLLRRTPLNRMLQERHSGPMFDDLIRQ